MKQAGLFLMSFSDCSSVNMAKFFKLPYEIFPQLPSNDILTNTTDNAIFYNVSDITEIPILWI